MTSQIHSDRTRPFLVYSTVLCLLASLTGLLWWPQGLNIPPTEDDWNNYTRLDYQALNPTETPISDASRPLLYLWWQIAYAMTPDSMLAVNWLTALAILVRAISFYAIVSYLTGHRGMALAAACLIIVIPVDFGVYEKGTFHIHVATTLYFMAAALFVFLSRRSHARWLWGLLWLVQLLACGTYESVYPLMILTPLLTVLTERRITRATIVRSLAWWGVPLLCGLFILLPTVTSETSYQRHMVADSLSLMDMVRTALQAYLHVLVKVWYLALRQPWGSFLVGQVVAGGAVAAGVWMISKDTPRFHPFRGLLLSLLMVGAGFAMYLPTSFLSSGSGSRVYYLTAGGAALFAVLVCGLVAQILRSRLVFALLIGGLVGLGLGGMLSIIRPGTLAHAYGQGRLLVSTVAQAPGLKSGTTLVFLFSGEIDNPFPDFQTGYFTNGIQYLYQDYSLRSVVCYDGDCAAALWQSLMPSSTLVFRVLPSLDVVLLESVPAFPSGYQPDQRLDQAAPWPHRLRTLYSQLPASS